eukprot:3566723-Rhodomonas_salina.2
MALRSSPKKIASASATRRASGWSRHDIPCGGQQASEGGFVVENGSCWGAALLHELDAKDVVDNTAC